MIGISQDDLQNFSENKAQRSGGLYHSGILLVAVLVINSTAFDCDIVFPALSLKT